MSLSSFKKNPMWEFLGSVKLALGLLCAIIAASFIGAVIPEEKQPQVYYSWWFIGLLAAFALNIFACSISRLSFSKKRLGLTVTHCSVLVILAGSTASYLWSTRGVIELEEGQSQDAIRIPAARGGQCGFKKLGFTVFLDDFSLQWYSNRPDRYSIGVKVDDAGVFARYTVAQGQQQAIGSTGYSFAVIGYMPDFSLDEARRARNQSENPVNPAALVRIASAKGSEERWVFAKHPEVGLMMAKDKNIRFKLNWQPMAKEFRSALTIVDKEKNRTVRGTTKVNAPFSYGGYTFYQAGYDDTNLRYTSLDVVRDPGAGIVFSGFILLNAGLMVVFLPKLGIVFGRKPHKS